MKTRIAEHIGDLIGKDKLEEAIHLLHKLLMNNKKLDEVIVQSARYNDITNQIRKGTLDVEKADISKNKIRYALLDILREIEENKSVEVSSKDVEGFFDPSVSIQQNHSGSGDNVVNKFIKK